MKILVTGAYGFIGRNIKSILPQEAEVIGIGHSDNPLPMANYKKIDVLDATAVEELFREYRLIKSFTWLRLHFMMILSTVKNILWTPA